MTHLSVVINELCQALVGETHEQALRRTLTELRAKVAKLQAEGEQVFAILHDPVCVEANLKRGFIAMPLGLHWLSDEETPYLNERNTLRAKLEEQDEFMKCLAGQNDYMIGAGLKYEAALAAVEWVWNVDCEDYCPWCENLKRDGHASDCKRQAALGIAP